MRPEKSSNRPVGPMDKARDYGSRDSRFESEAGFCFYKLACTVPYILQAQTAITRLQYHQGISFLDRLCDVQYGVFYMAFPVASGEYTNRSYYKQIKQALTIACTSYDANDYCNRGVCLGDWSLFYGLALQYALSRATFLLRSVILTYVNGLALRARPCCSSRSAVQMYR